MKRDRRGPPVKLDEKADEKDLHNFSVARERALKKADRPKETRKIVLDALKTLIGIFRGEAKERKASVATPGNTPDKSAPEPVVTNGSANGLQN